MHLDRTALVERLALVGIEVERERCDTTAPRVTALDLFALAELLDREEGAR